MHVDFLCFMGAWGSRLSRDTELILGQVFSFFAQAFNLQMMRKEVPLEKDEDATLTPKSGRSGLEVRSKATTSKAAGGLVGGLCLATAEEGPSLAPAPGPQGASPPRKHPGNQSLQHSLCEM